MEWLVRPGPIEIPPVAARVHELPRIVDEYVFDAVVELVPPGGDLILGDRDRQWLIDHAAGMSPPEI